MAIKTEKEPKKPSGGTIIDYVQWRGDVTFPSSPWNDIDSVITAMIAYANLGENELVFGSGRTLRLADLAASDLLTRLPQDGIGDAVSVRNRFLTDLANSDRFRDIVILDQVNDEDPARDIQFSATTMSVPDVGTVIAFRGTDTASVGWKEDFMMSYRTPVPSQAAAVAYLQKAGSATSGPLYLAGHSKGGNLALYAAAHTAPPIQERLRAVYSFDGPGLDDETIDSEGYRRIEPLIRSVVPHGSIVGMLMNYYPVYRVVRSSAHAIMQHDPFSWLLIGRRFLEEENLSGGARIMDQTVHEWLKSCSPDQREVFVTVVFSLLDRKGKNGENNSPLDKADDSTRRMLLSMINRLIAIHASISWDVNIRKPFQQAAEELRLKLNRRNEAFVKSEVIRIDNHGNGFRDATEEAERTGTDGGLDRRDTLNLVLLAEEMLGMAGTVTGDLNASFWVEHTGRQYELFLTTQTSMDKKKKKWLKASVRPEKKKKSPQSLQEKLGNIYERALASGSDDICFDLPAGADRAASGEWDGFERSVLLRLADTVRIAIYGSEVRMTVRKNFT